VASVVEAVVLAVGVAVVVVVVVEAVVVMMMVTMVATMLMMMMMVDVATVVMMAAVVALTTRTTTTSAAAPSVTFRSDVRLRYGNGSSVTVVFRCVLRDGGGEGQCHKAETNDEEFRHCESSLDCLPLRREIGGRVGANN